jgi:hypothetical protein
MNNNTKRTRSFRNHLFNQSDRPLIGQLESLTDQQKFVVNAIKLYGPFTSFVSMDDGSFSPEIRSLAGQLELPYTTFEKRSGRHPLLIFTDNGFGNLSDPLAMLKNVVEEKLSILISGFSTSETATRKRMERYIRQGYEEVQKSWGIDGITVYSSDGLMNTAYWEVLMNRMLEHAGFQTNRTIVNNNDINIAWFASPPELSSRVSALQDTTIS